MLPAGSPLSAWLTWLETLHPNEIELGLERVQAVLGRLDIQRPGHVLIVAGTNGKGSSVAMASALLHAAGLRVGAYTSPHIVDYNERISVTADRRRGFSPDSGLKALLQPAADGEIIAAFEKIESVRDDVPLTYFEYGTLAAVVVFSAANLDAWILEVGMGGRLDATNAIEPTAALITNVALDHCEWLGRDVETIAVEKAGVMRPGIPVVYGGTAVPQAILDHADAIGARLLLRGRDYDIDGVPQPGLVGEFQVGNAAAVLALLDASGLSQATEPALVESVLPTVRLDGRGQRISEDGCEWLLDVAHNPAAAVVLADTLASDGHEGRTVAVVAMLDDKDVEATIRALDEHVDLWIATTAQSRRAIGASELARRIANTTSRPCLVAASIDEAMQSARREVAGNDRILVTGSFYLVGPVLERLYSRPQS
jgi:dihydrofolate synthase/folylpolyglutamate synthase